MARPPKYQVPLYRYCVRSPCCSALGPGTEVARCRAWVVATAVMGTRPCPGRRGQVVSSQPRRAAPAASPCTHPAAHSQLLRQDNKLSTPHPRHPRHPRCPAHALSPSVWMNPPAVLSLAPPLQPPASGGTVCRRLGAAASPRRLPQPLDDKSRV